MAFEKKPNEGAIFQNQKKSEKDADRSGEFFFECGACGAAELVKLRGWLNKTKDGKPYLKLKKGMPFNNKQEQRRNDDEDIPF